MHGPENRRALERPGIEARRRRLKGEGVFLDNASGIDDDLENIGFHLTPGHTHLRCHGRPKAEQSPEVDLEILAVTKSVAGDHGVACRGDFIRRSQFRNHLGE